MTDLKDTLKNSYFNWLKDMVEIKDINGILEITSPMLDRHNDFFQIYVVPKNDGLLLTDDGYVVGDLLMSGCDLRSSDKRREMFQMIINSRGVSYSAENELYVETNIQNFPQKLHLLLQAMVTVNDMFMTTRTTVQRLFLEDVEEFIEDNEIRATENVTFTGRSGLSHRFDFVIPKSKSLPERVLQTMNNPTREMTQGLLFAWSDTKEVRKQGSTLYAFLNDSDKKVSRDIIEALTQYEVKPVLWSERNNFIPELLS